MRSLVLGNGSVLQALDLHGQIADIYFDYVGLENQMAQGGVDRVGIFVDNKIHWLSDPGWQIVVDFQKDSMVGITIAINRDIGVELSMIDAVYNEQNISIRKIKVKNLFSNKRKIKIFLHHQFHMYGITKGDTVYFDPDENAIIHYKGRRMALISGISDGLGFSSYTVGLAGIEGKEGTWRDAEDGELSVNSVEHGSVDSTIEFSKEVEGNSEWNIDTWICLAKTLEELKALNSLIKEKSSDHIIESTKNFWHAWINKNKEETNLSILESHTKGKDIIELYNKSLFIIRTHIDNTGPIIASGDSDMLYYGRDTYSYVWHRDAAFVAFAMDNAGYTETTHPFFEFSQGVMSPDGYFYHRYRSDRSIASSWHPWVNEKGEKILAIQEDETALFIWSLGNHYQKSKNLEFIEKIYNNVIKLAANFMVSYTFPEGLPKPSYDLWEMKYGIHTFTAASVSSALVTASEFASLLGKREDQDVWIKASIQIKAALLKYLWDEKENYFVKSINLDNNSKEVDPVCDVSSIYAVTKFDILDIDSDQLAKGWQTVKNKLTNPGPIGGLIRFEGDLYGSIEGTAHSNPWIITTLWLAQYYIKKAKSKDELKDAWDIILWAYSRAFPSGVLGEQVNPYLGYAISATPLIWSHAEFVQTVLEYIDKWKKLK